MSSISKSSVCKLCKDIDERVNAFLKRPLAGEWPYLRLDATYLKVREGGRIVSVAAIIAVAVTIEGKREIVGLHIGPSEAEPFWSTFLRDLVRRGLKGVKLVISDAHEGLKVAITRVVGATWQRCRVHFMRNALAHVSKGQNTMVAAAIRQVFLPPDHAAATQTWRHVADQLRARWPKLGACMDNAEHDVLAYMTFPEQHRVKLHSTNPLERLNKEVKRRADVVGIFPNEDSITRLIGAVLLDRMTSTSSRTATCRSRAWPPSPHHRSTRCPRYNLHPRPPDRCGPVPHQKLHHLDGHHLFAGSRMLRDLLRQEGVSVGRLHVATLMKRMRIEAIYRRPNTSKPAPGHKIYPYLLRKLAVTRPNQVWATDITYVPMACGFVHLVAIVDWFTRRVLAWRVSISLDAEFCIEAVEEALARYGKPAIFNSDQGSQFTSTAFTAVLHREKIAIRHGRERLLARHCVRGAPLALGEIRGGVPPRLRLGPRSSRRHRPVDFC